jgi:pre-mRNA-splicing helicase BRR2
MIGGNNGPVYEVVLSRTRYIAAQVEFATRIVGFGVSLANAKDVAEWLGVSAQNTFNFSPGARPLPMEVHLQSFNVPHFPSLMIQMAKPTYLAITESSDARPVIVFVPSRKYCRLAAQDLLQYCLADQDPLRFLSIEQADLEPHLERVQDASLQETLRNGIGYYHEGMTAQDRLIVERLYQLGAIQVVVASKETAWSIPLTAYMVILMGTQTFEGKEHRYVDYSFPDVLQMMGRACRPLEDANSKCVLMVPQVRKPFFLKFLNEGLPIESHVHLSLADFLLSEIAAGTIENKQECVDWFTWLWCYRRLNQNPNYYNLQGTSHRHLSDHLSQLIEDTLGVLEQAKCIAIEDDSEWPVVSVFRLTLTSVDLSVLNLGLIASFYQVSSITLDTFSMSLNEKTKLKGLLEIISSAVEFEDVPIRHHEEQALSKIYERLPVKLTNVDYQSPNFKTCLLLQAHFSRLPLPADLQTDQHTILGRVIKLLSAAVDVMSSSGYANALKAMDMTQMVVQAVWDSDSPLRQVPGFTKETIERCKAAGVETVWDITELEDDQRDKVLQIDQKQMAHVARFCNAYPSTSPSGMGARADNSPRYRSLASSPRRGRS